VPRRSVLTPPPAESDPRVELAEVQLRLGGLPRWSPGVGKLRRRQRELMDAAMVAWAEVLGCRELRLGIRAGAVCSASGTLAELIEELPRISRHACIERLTLEVNEEDGPASEWEAFLALPELAAVRSLRLAEVELRAESLGRLISSSAWNRLETLELGTGACDAELADALASATVPPSLRDLLCEGYMGGIGDRGLKALAQADWLRQLRRLDLRGQDISDTGLEALAWVRGPWMLEHLDLASVGYSSNDCTAVGMHALAASDWFPALRSLGMQGTPLGAQAVLAFLRATQLRAANLADVELPAEILRLITDLPAWQSLEELTLSKNPLGDSGAEALADCERLPQVLVLQSCEIGAVGLNHLADAPEVCALDLRWNPIPVAAWAEAIAHGQLPNTRALAVDATGWSDAMVVAIREHYPRVDLVGS
jgi:Leucine Rich Repeat (LRR) protein